MSRYADRLCMDSRAACVLTAKNKKMAIYFWLSCYSRPISSFSYITPTASEKMAKSTNTSKMCACRQPKIPTPKKIVMKAMAHQKIIKTVANENLTWSRADACTIVKKIACGNLPPHQKKICFRGALKCPESGGHCPGSHKILATGLAP